MTDREELVVKLSAAITTARAEAKHAQLKWVRNKHRVAELEAQLEKVLKQVAGL